MGQIYILLEVALLHQYQENPRVGNIEALYHVFKLPKNFPDIVRLSYDPKTTEI